MKETKARQEEFGAPAWAAMVLAVVLALAVGGPLLHPTAAAPATTSTAQVTSSSAR